MDIELRIELLEETLGPWQDTLSEAFAPYRNHVYRLLHYCFALHDASAEDREKLILAACFHDLGIWPDENADYLAPSVELARGFLRDTGRDSWIPEISRMIELHHKVWAVNDAEYPLVEVFRRGDWVDVTRGLRSFGLTKAQVREVADAFPNLGFHDLLMKLGQERFRRHPFNPLPMMKW